MGKNTTRLKGVSREAREENSYCACLCCVSQNNASMHSVPSEKEAYQMYVRKLYKRIVQKHEVGTDTIAYHQRWKAYRSVWQSQSYSCETDKKRRHRFQVAGKPTPGISPGVFLLMRKHRLGKTWISIVWKLTIDVVLQRTKRIEAYCSSCTAPSARTVQLSLDSGVNGEPKNKSVKRIPQKAEHQKQLASVSPRRRSIRNIEK